MAWRSQLPILTVGALGAMTASLGVGYGLGQYTVSGINPFYASGGTVARYTPRSSESAQAELASAAAYDFPALDQPRREF